MKKQIFSTDEAIISEYSRIYNELGSTKECCDALKELVKNITTDNKQLWNTTIKGIRYCIEGEMAKMQQKPYKNLFEKSLQELNKVKITDEESPVLLCVERNKLFALAEMDNADVDTVISDLKKLIEKFANSKALSIQKQVASSMLNASYYLNKIEKTEEAIEMQNKLIKKFQTHKSTEIQYIITICKNNQASDLEKLAEKQSEKLRNSIIEQYQDLKDSRISIQVSKAMYNQAMSFYGKSMQQYEMPEKRNEYVQKTIDIFTEQIKQFRNYTILNIKKDVLLSMSIKGDILWRQDELENALIVYEDLVNEYQNEKDFTFKMLAINALESMAKIQMQQYQQATNKDDERYYLNLAVNSYTTIINNYKNDNDFKFNVLMALSAKGSALLQLNNSNDAFDVNSEIIKSCREQGELNYFLISALESNGDILNGQSTINDNQLDKEKAEMSIQIYTELFELFEKQKIYSFRAAATMMKKAMLLLNLKYYDRSIEVLKGIINIYDSDDYKKDDRFQISVRDAKFNILSAMRYKAFELHSSKQYEGAIEEWERIVELCNLQEYAQEQFVNQFIDDAKQQIQFAKKIWLPFERLVSFYPQNEQNIISLMQSIAGGRLIPIIGAGLSRFAGYPLWGEFLTEVYNRNEKMMSVRKSDFQEKPYQEQAQQLFDDLGKNIFEQEVKRTFSDRSIPDTIKEEAIWWIPYFFHRNLILTTNFDNLLQYVYGQRGVTIFPYASDDIEKLRVRDTATSILYKTHGSVTPFTNIILTKQQYEEHYDKTSNNYKVLSANMQGHDRLFLGCSLEDQEILNFCEGGTNFTIYPCGEDEIIKVVRKLSNKGISVPILYPIDEDNNHSYLKFILEFIAVQMNMHK